jgi:hypothetical protein
MWLKIDDHIFMKLQFKMIFPLPCHLMDDEKKCFHHSIMTNNDLCHLIRTKSDLNHLKVTKDVFYHLMVFENNLDHLILNYIPSFNVDKNDLHHRMATKNGPQHWMVTKVGCIVELALKMIFAIRW